MAGDRKKADVCAPFLPYPRRISPEFRSLESAKMVRISEEVILDHKAERARDRGGSLEKLGVGVGRVIKAEVKRV